MQRSLFGIYDMDDEYHKDILMPGFRAEISNKRSLSDCMREAVTHYMQHLDGHDTTDFYWLVLSQVEPSLLEVVMTHMGGNQTKTAEFLGISRSTLRKKLKQYSIR